MGRRLVESIEEYPISNPRLLYTILWWKQRGNSGNTPSTKLSRKPTLHANSSPTNPNKPLKYTFPEMKPITAKDIVCKRCGQLLNGSRVILACTDEVLGPRILVECPKIRCTPTSSSHQ